MKTFTDKTGRSWSLVIDVDTIKRVRGLIDVNLIDVVEVKLFERIASDPVLLCDVVYAVCKPDADAANISDEEFGRAMAGDAIDSATTALLEELVNFFPIARRGVLAKALTKVKTLESMAIERATKMLDSDKLEQAMTAELDKVDQDLEAAMSGNSSGNSPASPESARDR